MNISPNAADIPNFPTMDSAIIIQLCAEICLKGDIHIFRYHFIEHHNILVNIMIHCNMKGVSHMILNTMKS